MDFREVSEEVSKPKIQGKFILHLRISISDLYNFDTDSAPRNHLQITDPNPGNFNYLSL